MAAFLVATVLPVVSPHSSIKMEPDRHFENDWDDPDGQVAILPGHSDLLPAGWCRLDCDQVIGAAVTLSCPLDHEAAASRETHSPRGRAPYARSLLTLCCLLTI